VKDQDQNLKPLTLTLKGDYYLKSIPGGIATIAAKLILILYILLSVSDVVKNNATNQTLNITTNVITTP